MTDEGSATASESTPAPEAPTTPPEPVISNEAVQEISAEITEAVKDMIMQEPAPETPQESPALSSSSRQAPQQMSAPKKLPKGHMLTVVRARKAERLEKVVALARARKVIMNDDVQKFLTISDASATNYLRELVKAGRLKRVGGKFHAHYELGG